MWQQQRKPLILLPRNAEVMKAVTISSLIMSRKQDKKQTKRYMS